MECSDNIQINPAKASFWYSICSVIRKGINVLLIPLYVRLMSTGEYGVYTLFQSWEGIILVFTTLNLASYTFYNCLIQHEDKLERVTSVFWGLILTLTAFCCLVFGFFIEFWERVFGLGGKYIFAMALDSMFMVIIDLWYARKKFSYQYQSIVAVTVITIMMNLGMGVAFIMLSFEKAFAAVAARVVAQGCVALVLSFDIYNKGRKFLDRTFWKYALNFNIPLIPHFLSARVLQQADRVMIQRLCSISQTGIYGFSYRISEAMALFNSAMLSSMIPWTYQKLKRKKYGEIHAGVFPTLLLIGGLNLLLILLAPEAVRILGTEEYSEAVYIIPPVACSIFFDYLFNVFVNVTYYYEQKQFVVIASVAAAILNIGLNWIFIPRFGYLAAGYTTLISYICLAIMHGIMYHYTLKIKGIHYKVYNMPEIILLSILFIMAGLGSILLYKRTMIRYGFVFLLGGGAVLYGYKYMAKLLKGNNVYEKEN